MEKEIEEGNGYYIISLKHTGKRDAYIALWRPDNAGYCFSKNMAGVYEDIKSGYHNDEGNMPIKLEDADPLFIIGPTEWENMPMIPNRKEIWDKLGVKMGKGRASNLERIANSK